DEHFGAIDDEVDRHRERKRVGPDDVLDHSVGDIERQCSRIDRLESVGGEACGFEESASALGEAEAVEAGEARRHVVGPSRFYCASGTKSTPVGSMASASGRHADSMR